MGSALCELPKGGSARIRSALRARGRPRRDQRRDAVAGRGFAVDPNAASGPPCSPSRRSAPVGSWAARRLARDPLPPRNTYAPGQQRPRTDPPASASSDAVSGWARWMGCTSPSCHVVARPFRNRSSSMLRLRGWRGVSSAATPALWCWTDRSRRAHCCAVYRAFQQWRMCRREM